GGFDRRAAPPNAGRYAHQTPRGNARARELDGEGPKEEDGKQEPLIPAPGFWLLTSISRRDIRAKRFVLRQIDQNAAGAGWRPWRPNDDRSRSRQFQSLLV